MKVFFFFLLISPFSFGQIGLGSIYGTVVDDVHQIPLPFAKVCVYASGDQSGPIIAGTETDFDGRFQLNSINPGVYDLEITDFVSGYDTLRLEDIRVSPESITRLVHIEMTSSEIIWCDFCFGYGIPVGTLYSLELDPFGRSITIKSEDIRRP